MAADKQQLELLMMAIKPLPDDDAKIQYICNVARGSSILSPETFQSWIKGVAPVNIFGFLTFCNKLRDHLLQDNASITVCSGVKDLVHGVVLNLHYYLTPDGGCGYKKETLSEFFELAVYFCQFLEGSSRTGTAQKLFRLYGEVASADFLEMGILHPELPRAYQEAIAEGVNKRIGPRLVLRVFLGVTGSKSVTEEKEFVIEAIKEEIRIICANRSTGMCSTLVKRDQLMTRLGRMMGEKEMQQWFADEFPDMVAY